MARLRREHKDNCWKAGTAKHKNVGSQQTPLYIWRGCDACVGTPAGPPSTKMQSQGAPKTPLHTWRCCAARVRTTAGTHKHQNVVPASDQNALTYMARLRNVRKNSCGDPQSTKMWPQLAPKTPSHTWRKCAVCVRTETPKHQNGVERRMSMDLKEHSAVPPSSEWE